MPVIVETAGAVEGRGEGMDTRDWIHGGGGKGWGVSVAVGGGGGEGERGWVRRRVEGWKCGRVVVSGGEVWEIGEVWDA